MFSTQNGFGHSVAVAVAFIQSIICLGCLTFIVYTHWTTGKRQRRDEQWSLSRFIPFCSIIALISFLISSINETIRVWTFRTFQDPIIQEIVSSVLISLCWSFGQFSSYMVFLLRLVDTFSNTTLQVPKIRTKCLMTLLILYEAAWTTKCVVPFVLWSDFINYNRNFSRFEVYITVLILILDFFITISMTFMFISRLFVVMRWQSENVHDQHLQMDELNRSLNAEGSNHRWMHLSVKIAVITITSLVSSLIVVSFDAVSYYFDDYEMRDSFVLIFTLWFQIDTGIISSICLILFLARAERMYRILCCCGTAVGYRCMRGALLSHMSSKTPDLPSNSEAAIGISSVASNNASIAGNHILSEDPSQIA